MADDVEVRYAKEHIPSNLQIRDPRKEKPRWGGISLSTLLQKAEELTSDNWAERFHAPAGITGLWQVEKRGGGEMSEDERKNLDNIYAREYSLWYDIKLVFRTIPALLQTENV